MVDPKRIPASNQTFKGRGRLETSGVLERIGRTKLSSLTVVAVKQGEIIYQRGFGLANREQGMARSFHARALAHADDAMAVPYYTDQDGAFVAAEYPWGQAEADGGLVSNVLDLAAYA